MLKGDATAVKAIIDRLFGNELIDSLNPEMNAIWEVYKNYINKDLKIKFEIPKGYENAGRFDGVYRYGENTIYINPNVFKALYNDVAKESKDGKVDILQVMNKFKTLMMEEVLHSIQVDHLKAGWNTPQGKSIREKYQKALTLGIVNPYLQNTGNELVDVAEFIAGIYASPELRQDLEKADKGFINRFLSNLKRLLQELIPGKGFETIHHNMIEMVKQNFGNVNFLESQQKAQEVKEVKRELSPSEKLNEIRKDEVQVTPVKNEKGISTNPSEFINHSGGAKGGDTMWDQIGREFGVTNHNHYTVTYYDTLIQKEKNQLQEQYIGTVNFLKRGVINGNTYAGKLVRRDMIQANNGDAIFGITELVKPGIKGRKGYINKTKYSIPEGGTGYAVARGILLNKPTYVFNQSNSYGNEIGWYIWNNSIKDFVKTDTPTLTSNFTGIGSQEINDLGKQAIRDVYEKSINANVSPDKKDRVLKLQNLFTVKPIQAVDKKAVIKASIATQFIGFGEGIAGSSTELYRQQAGKFANTGNYSTDDVIFVSIGGKRPANNLELRKSQQDRTIKEALKAIENGATLITDNKSYVESSTYNEGEKRLAKNLEAKGYIYSEQTIDGQLLGIWNIKDTFDEFNNTDFESRDNFSNFAEEAFECK